MHCFTTWHHVAYVKPHVAYAIPICYANIAKDSKYSESHSVTLVQVHLGKLYEFTNLN